MTIISSGRQEIAIMLGNLELASSSNRARLSRKTIVGVLDHILVHRNVENLKTIG